MKQKKLIALFMALVFMLMVPLGVFAKESNSDVSSITETPIQQVDKKLSDEKESKPTTIEPTSKPSETEKPNLTPLPDNPAVLDQVPEAAAPPTMDLPSFNLPKTTQAQPIVGAEPQTAATTEGVLTSGDYQYKLVDGGVEITKYIGKNDADTAVTIPDTIDNKAVVAIGERAFGQTNIKSVTMGNNLKKIEKNAFGYCPNLSQVILSKSAIEIGEGAFTECKSLKRIELPNTITTIYEGAFSQYLDIRIYGQPGSIAESYARGNGFVFNEQKFGDYYFEDCTYENSQGIRIVSYTGDSKEIELDSLNGKNILEIRKNAFQNNKELEQVAIGKNIKVLGDRSFWGCSNLKKFSLSDGLKEIGFGIFDDNAIETMNIPDSVESIGEMSRLKKLKKITIGTGVTKIPNNFLNNCRVLESIEFRGNIKTIGVFAFAGCASLKEMVIPESVIEMNGREIFHGCEEIRIFGKSGSCAEQYAKDNNLIFINENSKQSEGYYYNEINGGVTIINYNGKNTELNIPESLDGKPVIGIEASAFRKKDIVNIELPKYLKEIKDSAFVDCSQLRTAVIPENVEVIAPGSNENEGIFKGCNRVILFGMKDSNAEAYAIEKRIPFVNETTILEKGYYYESNDDGVKIIFADNPEQKSVPQVLNGKKVIAIGDRAFYEDNTLETIVLSNVKTIGNRAFEACKNVKTLQLNEQLISIGEWAFSYCPTIPSAEVPNSTKSMGTGAFAYCEGMTSVTLGAGIQTIETDTFTVTGISTLTLPSSIKMVKPFAIDSSKLESIIIPESAQGVTLEKLSFAYGNPNFKRVLKSAYLPIGVTTIKEKAFSMDPREKDLTIYGQTGTVAETYAKAYNINFSTEVYKLGDVNKDTNINASDSLLTLRHSVKEIALKDSDFTRGDVNKDSTVNASDGLQILRYSVKEINSFD